MKLNKNEMYQAIINKDTQYEGVFYTAVITTGIFCRPSCPARKPKIENVEFYSDTKEAISKGYRPCKVCKPMGLLNQTPEYVQRVISMVHQNPSIKIKDNDLRKMSIEPNSLRRWFLKNHGISFHAYQRMYRINTAFNKINAGQKITTTAFDSGYESLSGFGDSFKSIFGASPTKSKKQEVINIKRIESPLGTMFACATNNGICLLEFTDRRMLEAEFNDITRRLNAVIIQGENIHINHLEEELVEYFNGNRREFTVPLDPIGTDFQKEVWKLLLQISYGKTATYKQQAIKLNKPSAIRAVARANGMNKISILIPCHRVIGSDGRLTGYGGGLARKQALLDLEEKGSSQLIKS